MTAVIAGTTGLIGSQLLELLLQDPYYTNVIALSRKPLALANSKLKNLVVDFDKLSDYGDQLKGNDVFCCLGTTIKVAGSKEAFRKVDETYPLALANITHRGGATQFLIVTALGANKNSSIFYNQVKGTVEEELKKISFESLHIFQPSMLMGPRKEKRKGEEIGQSAMKAVGFLIPKKFKAIDSIKVARAMVAIAKQKAKGIHTHHSGILQDY
jgi:uncharacterized protein YbjT (DUF2867 family)